MFLINQRQSKSLRASHKLFIAMLEGYEAHNRPTRISRGHYRSVEPPNLSYLQFPWEAGIKTAPRGHFSHPKQIRM